MARTKKVTAVAAMARSNVSRAVVADSSLAFALQLGDGSDLLVKSMTYDSATKTFKATITGTNAEIGYVNPDLFGDVKNMSELILKKIIPAGTSTVIQQNPALASFPEDEYIDQETLTKTKNYTVESAEDYSVLVPAGENQTITVTVQVSGSTVAIYQISSSVTYTENPKIYSMQNYIKSVYLTPDATSQVNLTGIDLTKATTLNNALEGYTAVTSITPSKLDTPNAKYIDGTFKGLVKATSVPELTYTSAVKVASVYENDVLMTSLPPIDAPQALEISRAYAGCTAMTEQPEIIAPKCTDFHEEFRGCSALTEGKSIGTAKAKNISGMYYDCIAMTSVTGDFDLSSIDTEDYDGEVAEGVINMFKNSGVTSAVNFTNVPTELVTNNGLNNIHKIGLSPLLTTYTMRDSSFPEDYVPFSPDNAVKVSNINWNASTRTMTADITGTDVAPTYTDVAYDGNDDAKKYPNILFHGMKQAGFTFDITQTNQQLKEYSVSTYPEGIKQTQTTKEQTDDFVLMVTGTNANTVKLDVVKYPTGNEAAAITTHVVLNVNFTWSEEFLSSLTKD